MAIDLTTSVPDSSAVALRRFVWVGVIFQVLGLIATISFIHRFPRPAQAIQPLIGSAIYFFLFWKIAHLHNWARRWFIATVVLALFFIAPQFSFYMGISKKIFGSSGIPLMTVRMIVGTIYSIVFGFFLFSPDIRSLFTTKPPDIVLRALLGMGAVFALGAGVFIVRMASRTMTTFNIEGDALMRAAQYDHFDQAKHLLDQGTDINATLNDGTTALILAANHGHPDIAQLLLDHGATINAKTKVGYTALMAAAQGGYSDIAKVLLERGAELNGNTIGNSTPLMFAVMGGHADAAKLLIDRGAQINASTKAGETPLMFAAEFGHPDMVSLLLRHGANIDAKAFNGMTPLMGAAINGNPTVMQLLLAKGADIKVRTGSGYTPLTLGAYYGHLDIVKMLLGKGANWGDLPPSTTPTDLICKGWKDPMPCPNEEILKTVTHDTFFKS
jgi:ankyrin repeat protein